MSKLIRNRGIIASLGFFCSRLFRIQRHMVFECDLRDIPSVDWPSGVDVIPLITAQDITSEIHQQLIGMTPENEVYLNDIRAGNCIGLVVRKGRTIAHFGFIMIRSRTLCLLGLPSDAALLGNAYTLSEFRGQGFQTRSITQRLILANRNNFAVAYSETAPDNYISQRGIKRGGMKTKGEITLFIIMNFLAIRLHSSYKTNLFSICIKKFFKS